MEKDEELWEECLNCILQLSLKSQEAIFWLIDNYEFAVELCKIKKLTSQKSGRKQRYISKGSCGV